MESLNALIQGMGLMHLGAGQAVMLLVSLLLLWLAIAKKFEPLLLLPMSTARLSICPCTDGRASASAALMAWTSGAQWSFAAITASCAGSW